MNASHLLSLVLYAVIVTAGSPTRVPRSSLARDELQPQRWAHTQTVPPPSHRAEPNATTATHQLSLRFVDAITKQPIAARAGLFDAGGVPIPPISPDIRVYQNFGWRSYFYSDSIAAAYVPAGPIMVRAGRGFEYFAVDSTWTITSDTTITIELERFIDMKAFGWYSGDTHVHMTHPPRVYQLGALHLKEVVRAEDLNVVNSMEEQQAWVTGSPHPVSTPEHVIVFSKEQRNPDFSHLSLLGLQEWIPGMSCGDSITPCGRTLDGAIYDIVHAQGPDVAVIAAHPVSTTDVANLEPWPGGGMWRAMPMDLVGSDVDAMDLLSYSNVDVQTALEYYEKALNAGFRLPPSAGTDAAIARGNTLPPGGYRVYVMPPEGSGFTFATWVQGLRAGRSFVSNYPLFTEFTIDGAMAGDIIEHNGQLLSGTVTAWCQLPMDTLRIIANGEVLHTFLPDPDSLSFSAEFTVDPSQATWVIARVNGNANEWHPAPAPGLFAQTAPIYLQPAPSYRMSSPPVGSAVTAAAAASFFIDVLSEIEEVFQTGNFPENSQAAFDSALANAFDYFGNLYGVPATGAGGGGLPPAKDWWLASPRPNPFQSSLQIEYGAPVGGENVTVRVYDAAGRLVRRLPAGTGDGLQFTTVWDGRNSNGNPAASGVYFVRVESPGLPSQTRKAVLVR